MKNIEPSILILDDELHALSYMKETVEEVKNSLPAFVNYNLYSTHQYNEFMQMLKVYLPRIVFLDIHMPAKTGLEIAEEIRKNYKEIGYESAQLPIIVFSTAYENYGYQAFHVNAADYILKPVDNDKIEHVFRKIEQNFPEILKQTEETITVHSSGIDMEIPLKDILYFKADMKYIAVVTAKKEFLINTTLLNLEEKFPQFVKIHRAYLVNPGYIQKFYRKENHWLVIVKGHDHHLPVSRRQKQEIEGKINYIDLVDEDF